MVTQREEGRKLLFLVINNSEVLTDLFKDCAGYFGLNLIREIPTSVIGTLKRTLCTIEGTLLTERE
jgi:hypothetical protein